MGILDPVIKGITKGKILEVIKDPDIKAEAKKIAISVDVILDKVVGDKGSSEVRIAIADLLDTVKEGILKGS